MLDAPDRVADDGYVAFSSALYRFMTPILPGPSPHNSITGFFEPNSTDNNAGHKGGFGTVIQALNKADCGKWNT